MPPVVTIIVGEGVCLLPEPAFRPGIFCGQCSERFQLSSKSRVAPTRGDRVPAHEERMSFEERGSSPEKSLM